MTLQKDINLEMGVIQRIDNEEHLFWSRFVEQIKVCNVSA